VQEDAASPGGRCAAAFRKNFAYLCSDSTLCAESVRLGAGAAVLAAVQLQVNNDLCARLLTGGQATPPDDTPSEEKIEQAFAVFDTDGSGALDRAEFKAVLMSTKGKDAAPLSEEQVERAFEQVDTDHSGEVI
jgi:Ca2+-binding EF-hand superfamily protein